MSALPQHYIRVGSDENFSSEISHPQLIPRKQVTSRSNSQKSLSRFPKSRQFPAYLKILLLLQRGFLGVAGLSMVTGIVLYLSTVSFPQKWSQEYRNLETLQRQERQLTTIGESLKYKISQQAPQFQMSPITSSNTVFLKPKTVAMNPQATENTKGKSLKKVTLGY